ncbi:MAG: hypothetical protein WD712_02995 [Candidatus Spechtbacterales bacterium]
MSEEYKVSKLNRRRKQNEKGKKHRAMPKHGMELKHTLKRHIEGGKKKSK